MVYLQGETFHSQVETKLGLDPEVLKEIIDYPQLLREIVDIEIEFLEMATDPNDISNIHTSIWKTQEELDELTRLQMK